MAGDLGEAFARFATGCRFVTAQPQPGGLIHHSWRVTAAQADEPQEFLLQQMNASVFTEPSLVMQNIALVTEHLRHLDPPETTLEFLPVKAADEDGPWLWRDPAGAPWRLCRFIAGTRTADRASSPDLAASAGQAYGRFLQNLAEFPAPRLGETLPRFHHTPTRWAACQEAYTRDQAGRAAAAQDAWHTLAGLSSLAEELDRLDLPLRVVHNDAKLANVLLDAATDAAVCVVDLDTVMPGTALHDFGDMVRTICCTAPEEETDLTLVSADAQLFAALAGGYLAEAGAVLTPQEKDNLVTAGLVITFEQAARYLTDFLQGDTYYPVDRPDRNLLRCRNQIRLLRSLQEQAEDWRSALA